MQLSVDLEQPFHYSILILFLIVIFLLLSIISIIMARKLTVKKKTNKKITIEKQPDVNSLIEKYLASLENLKKQITERKISNRKAYQETSYIVRSFIFEATGIDVRKYALGDFAKDNKNQHIYTLIAEYYNPEFAKESAGEIFRSIQRTEELISSWK